MNTKSDNTIKYLQKQIDLSPKDFNNYRRLGEAFANINNHQNAITYYEYAVGKLKTAIKRNPYDSYNYNIMGLCLDDLRLPHQAINYYKKAIYLSPNKDVYYYNLSTSEDSAHYYKDSIKDMEYALKLNPMNFDAYNQLSIYNCDDGHYYSAIQDMNMAIELNRIQGHEDKPYFYLNLSDYQKDLGNYHDGIISIKHAIKLLPFNQNIPREYTKRLRDLKNNIYSNGNETANYNDTTQKSRESNEGLSYNPNINYASKLDDLIGLKPVKVILRTFIHQVEMNELRYGTRRHKRMHLVFCGNPGTGKTTVAKLFCRILYQKHIITKKRFTSINATQLSFSGYGKSAKYVRSLVSHSVGGVLFIDEAYYLTHRSDGNSACQDEALDALLSAIDKHDNDLVVILAGYTNKMKKFFDKSNPGLKSRFPMQERISFPDYSKDECIKILYYFMNRNGYKMNSSQARQLLYKYMSKYIVTKLNDSQNTFANARTVQNIYDQLTTNLSNRLLNRYSFDRLLEFKQNGSQILNRITAKDVKNTFKCYSLDSSYNNASKELDNMIGLRNVKQLVRSYVNLARISKLRHGSVIPDGMDLIFKGNPGTGKTTVAKLFCKLLYQRGLVKSDNYVSLSASSLESSVVGESARNLRQAFYNAKGGVLFIDEAYALLNTKKKGNNLLPELVSDLSKYKNSVVVIMAGYPEAMEHLLRTGNTGLSSRFMYRVPFKDYSDKECLQILYYDMRNDSLRLKDEKTQELLTKGFCNFIERAKSNTQYKFANARTVNIFFKYLKQCFANRLCDTQRDTWLKTLEILNDNKINTITSEDVEDTLDICKDMYKSQTRTIGFH